MSARMVASVDGFQDSGVTVEARQTRLSLAPGSVLVRRNGIEFLSSTPFADWTEMTVTLQSPGEAGRIHCSGVVVACTGNRHGGYHVSMLFTGLTKQSQERLSVMAAASAG